MPAPQSTTSGSGVARERVVERRAEQADEVADLLELAARVGVELTVAREQVEILEQLDRHSFRNVGIGARVELHPRTVALFEDYAAMRVGVPTAASAGCTVTAGSGLIIRRGCVDPIAKIGWVRQG